MNRTTQQNKALHVYFEMLATELNDAGLDMRKALKPHVEIPWDKNAVKEYIWRPVQEAQLGKKSTTAITTKDLDKVFETINRYIGDKHGLHVEFPSITQLIQNHEDQ